MNVDKIVNDNQGEQGVVKEDDQEHNGRVVEVVELIEQVVGGDEAEQVGEELELLVVELVGLP